MRELAMSLLYRFNGIVTPTDVETLADDLANVEYEPRLDGPFVARTTEAIFLRRIGGLGNLGSYMECIRPKSAVIPTQAEDEMEMARR